MPEPAQHAGSSLHTQWCLACKSRAGMEVAARDTAADPRVVAVMEAEVMVREGGAWVAVAMVAMEVVAMAAMAVVAMDQGGMAEEGEAWAAVAMAAMVVAAWVVAARAAVEQEVEEREVEAMAVVARVVASVVVMEGGVGVEATAAAMAVRDTAFSDP